MTLEISYIGGGHGRQSRKEKQMAAVERNKLRKDNMKIL